MSPANQALLHWVRRHPLQTACQLARTLGKPQSAVSLRLRLLKNAGWIRITYNPACVYTVTPAALELLSAYAPTEHVIF